MPVLRVGLVRSELSPPVRACLLELVGVAGPAIEVVDLDSTDVDAPPVHLSLDVTAGDGRTADVDVVLELSADRRRLVEDVTTLWEQRLLPFEANLRMHRRAPRARQPVLAAPSDSWARSAGRLIRRLERALGPLALRVDHIGSTSVPGLRAKDLIDIQVTVATLDAASLGATAAHEAGFVAVRGDWFGEDAQGVAHREHVAVDADPGRPVNINFRPTIAPVWREALLFREWLRAHPEESRSYEAMKTALVTGGAHVDRYSEDKMPWIRDGLARAEQWAIATGWSP